MSVIGWIFAILIFVLLLLLEYHTVFEKGASYQRHNDEAYFENYKSRIDYLNNEIERYEKYVNKLEEEQKNEQG